MKLNKIALAVVAAVAMPVVANAGVTVTPLILGYHVAEGINDTADKQKEQFGGYAQKDGLYTGAGFGIELTPTVALELEYGETSTDSVDAKGNTQENPTFEEKMYSGNFTVGTETFTGYTNSKVKPYVLVGAGQSKTSLVSGNEKATSTDTIGNLGLGAYYRLNDALSLRGEARAIHNFDHNWWEGMALAGLNVVLGGHLAPAVATVEPTIVEPVVVKTDGDADQDGVLDSVDQCPNTPLNVVVDANGCPKQLDQTDALRMELRVFFDNDKTVIKDQYKPEIQKVAEKMNEYPNSTASIEGHASKTGPSARYNQRLSEARANAVKSMLVNQYGIAPTRVSTVGYGYDRPIADNNTAEGRAMNRRVYAIITGNKTATVTQTKDMNVQ
ncbi:MULTISPECIES: OmpA family protein [unclassified Moraxella]|uniref:OmpA family protein n=1 Tax=unclassified Moraxella TaxID=2685852 RepID=UPI003AF76ED1